MPKEAIFLVRAIENGHIPLEEDLNSIIETPLLSNDPVARKGQRNTLELTTKEIDDAVKQVDVLSVFP